MSSVLTIYLNAFMQSFGRNSISTCRDTGVLPTKSMVIGLILNALGHDNTSEEEKDYPEQMSNALRFATKQLYTKSSSKMVDFCVARRCDKQSDILYKEYIVGSRYNVYLEGDSSDIEKIAEALLFPKRALYSGRKCCTFSSPLCWDSKNNIPTITKNSHIENLIFNDINLTNPFPKHVIECGNMASFSNRTLTKEITDIINKSIGENKWIPTFSNERKTNPIRFGNQLWGDLFCYSVKYLKYNDMKEL